MTVENTLRKAGPFTGDGVTDSFPFDFKVFAGTDVQVTELVIATGVETVKTITTHYTVTVNADQDTSPGGTVEAVAAPAAGIKWTITSAVPAAQASIFTNGGGYYPKVHENALDKLTILIQQQQELQSRSLLLPVSFDVSALLPAPQGSHLLGWSPDGSELQNFGPTDTTALSAALAASSGSSLVSFIAAGAGAAARSVQSKLRDVVSAKDNGATGDGSTDDTTAIQAAIDTLTGGGTVYLPAGDYRAAGLKLDGTSGTLNNIRLLGDGFSTRLRAVAGSNLNVVEATAGSGHTLANLRVSGAKDTGGTAVPAPTKGFWATGVSYVVNDTVEVTSLDAATTTVAASNLVYRCTSNHAAGATFAGDKATKWVLSTDANFNTSDLSYRHRNGIYFDGVSNCAVENVLVDQCVYAGINVGSGPVQLANIGTGVDRVQVERAIITDCENGIAGGRMRDVEFTGLQIYNCDEYGAVVDTESARVSFNGLQAVGCGNHGLYLYDADAVTVNDYIIAGCLNGIVAEGGTTLVEVGSGAVRQCTNLALFFRGVTLSQVGGLIAHANTKGIELDTCSQIKFTKATANANTASSGFKATSCSAISFSSCQSIGNYAHGFELQSCSQITLNDVAGVNNNTVAAASGAGVYGNNSTNITVTGGSLLTDTRGGGSKTQNYGVFTAGTSAGWAVVLNRLAGNNTGTFSLAGSNNTEMLNDNAITVSKLGSAVAAAAVPANFSPQTVITVTDIGGATRYVAAMNSSW